MRVILAIVGLWCSAAGLGQSAGIRSYLANLQPGDPESLCLARGYVESRLSHVKPAEGSAAFFALWDFYDETVRLNQAGMEQVAQGLSPAEYDLLVATLRIPDVEKRDAQLRAKCSRIRPKLEPWLRCGFVIGVDFEETLFLDPNPWFLRAVHGTWNPETQEYLNLFLTGSPYSLDYVGALAIPWDRLRSRIVRWEHFRAAHSENSDLVRHIDRQIARMFQYYLCGLPNSVLFGPNGKLIPDARWSYTRFLQTNPASHEYKTVESAMRLLQSNNWRVSRRLIQLYRSRGYSTDLLEDALRGARR